MADDSRPGNPPDIETVASRVVYQNRWMRVREDAIRRRDGSDGIYGVVERPNSVIVVPLDSGRRLHLVQQYRYAVEKRYWELPQGTWEHLPDADPLEMARGELREETGLAAAEMIHAGRLYEAYGYATQAYDIFLATGLRPVAAVREHEEQDLVTRDFPLAEVERMIREDEIRDAATVASLGLLRLKGLL